MNQLLLLETLLHASYINLKCTKPKHSHSQDKGRTQTIVSGVILEVVIVIPLLR